MGRVGRHSGERATETAYVAPTPPRTKILVLALVVTLTLVAWGVLVYAAIDFGGEARSGEPVAWLFLALATLGAAACLFTTLLLGGRILTLVRGAEPAPARPKGGHRAVR
jgi:hypothetical protein